MILFSHPFPTSSVQHTAAALTRAGLLGEFWTCVGKRPHLVERDAFPAAATFGARLEDSVNDRPPFASTSACANDGQFTSNEDLHTSHLLDQRMRVRLSRGDFDGVYAFEQAAEASFRAAARLDLLRIYDVPLGHWRGAQHPILTEEAALEPEWAPTLAPYENGAGAAEKARSELTAADLVLVSNSFGLHTLEQTDDFAGTIAVATPGAPPPVPAAEPTRPSATSAGRVLRVLYAGPLTQRAGLSYAFRACRELGSSVAFTVIAPPPMVPCLPLRRELDRVRWLATASMEVVRREMAAADVFLAPAIYDTNSELLLQALVAGLPIIATLHSAAPDLIRDGKEGFIIPIRSAESIAAKLQMLRCDADLRTEMSQQARRHARDHSWRRYEDIVIASVATALTHRGAPASI